MYQQRLDLLREALPYIQRFKGKTFVVKLSGKVTEEHENLFSLAEELALMHQVGIRLCVVHGGGKQLTELAAQMGVEQTIIDGRRVTDDATLDMAKMMFAGKINTDILAALHQRGVEAVGLSGVDGNIVLAERRPPKEITNRETGVSSSVDFGHVGDIVRINDRLLQVLLDHDYMPVVSSLGADVEGRVFNINADTIAAEIAVRLKAEKLIMLSDVDGIYLRPGEQAAKLSRLTMSVGGRRSATTMLPSTPDRPTAATPWWRSAARMLMFIFPANIIFAMSRVASSVTRRPSMIVCSTPSSAARSVNCFPPPCTTHTRMPT